VINVVIDQSICWFSPYTGLLCTCVQWMRRRNGFSRGSETMSSPAVSRICLIYECCGSETGKDSSKA